MSDTYTATLELTNNTTENVSDVRLSHIRRTDPAEVFVASSMSVGQTVNFTVTAYQNYKDEWRLEFGIGADWYASRRFSCVINKHDDKTSFSGTFDTATFTMSPKSGSSTAAVGSLDDML